MRGITTATPTRSTNGSTGDQKLLTPSFLLLTVSGFFALAGFSSTLPLVPRYVDGVLGGSKVEIGLALGVFSISAVFARPMVGRLGDERGRRFIIVWGTALTAVTVAAHALASSIRLLYLVRLAMGATQGASSSAPPPWSTIWLRSNGGARRPTTSRWRSMEVWPSGR